MKKVALLLSVMIIACASSAQQPLQLTDPFDNVFEWARRNNPNFQKEFELFQKDISAKAEAYTQSEARQAHKGTARKNAIPVIFHIVLNNNQIRQMGGRAAIIARIESQMTALNEAYNKGNADSNRIPAPFKSLYADMDIQFALAKRDPRGNPTPGYEFVSTTKDSFSVDNSTIGSRDACSDVKFKRTGGVPSWDTKKYLNIWVANITPMGVAGVATPPPHALYGGPQRYPWAEQGVVIHYGTLGVQNAPGQFFLTPTANKGRVLVHEIGHFFNLFHPFGISTFNNNNCQDDDGVADTPPQAGPTQSVCPQFPKTDVCSPNAPGIMFTNFMDYSDETCALMFTTGQKARAYVEINNNGFRSSLFQHPELLQPWPNSVNEVSLNNNVSVAPNPTSGNCHVYFNGVTPIRITIVNKLGQTMYNEKVREDADGSSLNLTGYVKDLYFIQCHFRDGVITKKIIVR